MYGSDLSSLDNVMNQRLDSKQYAGLVIMVVVYGELINEGESLAVIRMDPEEDFQSHIDFLDQGQLVCPRNGFPYREKPDEPRARDADRPPRPRLLGDGRFALPAGQRAEFRLQIGMAASQWYQAFERYPRDASAGRFGLTIEVSDQFADGIVDSIGLGIQALPVVAHQNADGWLIPPPVIVPSQTDPAVRASFVLPTRRHYRESRRPTSSKRPIAPPRKLQAASSIPHTGSLIPEELEI